MSTVLLGAAVSALIAGPALAGNGHGGGGGNNNNSGGNSSGGQTVLATCANTDITLVGLGTNATGCEGFDDGNLLSNKSSDVTQMQTELGKLGFAWDGNFNNVVKLSDLKGSQTLNFGQLLTGKTYIGVHYGNGQDGPGNGTAFYVLDAAQGVNQIHLAYGASSGAVLFVTGIVPHVAAVPEPASWAMMIGGFGAIGTQMRRQRRRQAVAA